MKLEFDLENVTVTEFGVGRDDVDGQTFVAVPVDADVQAVLREMVRATWDAMQNDKYGPARYEPSEKHGSTEYLYLPLMDDMASSVRELHEATTMDIDGSALDEPADVFCYFCTVDRQQESAFDRCTPRLAVQGGSEEAPDPPRLGLAKADRR